MATTPPAPDRRTEVSEIRRKMHERMEPARVRVLQQLEVLRRIREEQESRRRR
jgi:hypothetical protein